MFSWQGSGKIAELIGIGYLLVTGVTYRRAVSEVYTTSSKMPFHRHVLLEGAFNFRDLGGYLNASGRRVRIGQLYRSDDLFRLSDADLAELSRRQIRLVIDLRTNEEAGRRGTFEHHGHEAGYLRIPLMDVSAQSSSPTLPDSYLEDRYREILIEGGPHFARILDRLLQENALPAIFHCAVGKDRTGLLAMLLLGLLDVSDEVIVADYALTKIATTAMISWLRLHHPEVAESIDALPPILISSEPETMESTLAWLRRTFGNFENYAAYVGISHATIEQLRLRLLE
jgi:protein-tyrosine phosphatase